jgi:hypothetical protein
MRKAFGEYRRLARGTFGCSSVWAGDGHLLYVRGTGLLMPVYEEYRRVRYSEIEAVSVAPTAWWWVMLVSGGVMAVLAGVPAAVLLVKLATGDFSEPGEAAFSVLGLTACGLLTLAALAVVVWNAVRGPTCHCGVQTQEGVLRLRPASRTKRAIQVAAAIAAAAEAKQGRTRSEGEASSPTPTPAPPPPPPPPPAPAR